MNETITAISLAALSLGVIVFLIWALVWVVLARWDRRVKDGPRCRHCGYDLRASSGDSCPECGKSFAPRGVWPAGLPNRGPAIHRIAIWLWLCLVGTIIASNMYSSHIRTWWEHEQHDQALVFLARPESGTYTLAYISLSGEGWRSAKESPDGRIRPTQWSIFISSAGVEVQTITVDAKTARATPHLLPELADGNALMPAHAITRSNGRITPEDLADFHPLGLNEETDAALLKEMELLIELAQHLATDELLPRSVERANEQLQSFPRIEELEASYEKQLAFQTQQSAWEIEPLPYWPLWFVLGAGVLAITLGTVIIRKRVYQRMAVDAIPQAEPLAQSNSQADV